METPDGLLPVTIDSLQFAANLANRAKTSLTGRKIPLLENHFRGNHGKLLTTDEKNAFWGTHNLAQSGVGAGAKEWQILTTDPVIVRNLLTRYHDFREETSKINDVF